MPLLKLANAFEFLPVTLPLFNSEEKNIDDSPRLMGIKV